MRDNYGDTVEVEGRAGRFGGGRVLLTVSEGEEECSSVLSPEKARKLARKLKRAADAVEAGGR